MVPVARGPVLVGAVLLSVAVSCFPKPTTLQGQSGRPYEILKRATLVVSDGKILTVTYLAEGQSDVVEFERAAEDIMPVIEPEAEAGGYVSVAILAATEITEFGPVRTNKQYGIVYKRQSDGTWKKHESNEQSTAAEQQH